MSTASQILGRIEDDPVFRGFLESGFDPAAFASKIVKADVGKAVAMGGAGIGASGSTVLIDRGATVAQALPGGGGGGLPAVSAESVSSQAEITLDVSWEASFVPVFQSFVAYNNILLLLYLYDSTCIFWYYITGTELRCVFADSLPAILLRARHLRY